MTVPQRSFSASSARRRGWLFCRLARRTLLAAGSGLGKSSDTSIVCPQPYRIRIVYFRAMMRLLISATRIPHQGAKFLYKIAYCASHKKSLTQHVVCQTFYSVPTRRARGLFLLDKFHLARVARFGLGLFVGIAHGNHIADLVAVGQVELLEVGLAVGVGLEEAHGTAEAARAET